MTLLDRYRTWQANRRWRRIACERALAEFALTHTERAMGAHVLRLDAQEAVVRVMYAAGHIPPGRCWYAIPRNGGAARVLSFDDVATMESPWR
ncbi:hypothetical protein ACSFBF_12765 [Variovorax sp. ZT5P49]|uniref:hypothetical protein n=1 Tax=Variovorax sp. ZT5P49 TaxID=3443733 RepID=UPI003F48938B